MTSVTSVSPITDQILSTFNVSCYGCNLLFIADKNNWEGETLKLPSGVFTCRGHDGWERGVQQDALCRFYHQGVDTLCGVCTGLHKQLMNFARINGPKT